MKKNSKVIPRGQMRFVHVKEGQSKLVSAKNSYLHIFLF